MKRKLIFDDQNYSQTNKLHEIDHHTDEEGP
jgi:hypothetical protein